MMNVISAQGDALGADLVTACMGASVADMNRDGYLDLYMTSIADQHLLENEKDGYIEISHKQQVVSDRSIIFRCYGVLILRTMTMMDFQIFSLRAATFLDLPKHQQNFH